MASEKKKIINMLEEGKISADDAARLLEALGEDEDTVTTTTTTTNNNVNVKSASGNPALKGKKLRVKVEGSVDEMESLNVNIAVPLALAKLADNILTSVIPKEVNKELEAEGINLKNLNIGELVENLTDLDEDIVNVEMAMKGKPMKVRVYVE